MPIPWMDMMVINEKFYTSLTRARIHHYSCLSWTFWTYGRKLLFGSGNSSFGWRPRTYPFYTVSVLSFFPFDFLFFRVINEEITSSVLLCKPIYQRHFYSNDFKNKPFPFFGISRGHFWEIQIYQRIKTAASLQQFAEKTARFCDNVPGHLTY